jgi:hypothetical protein
VFYKLGLELFMTGGCLICDWLVARSKRVFVDRSSSTSGDRPWCSEALRARDRLAKFTATRNDGSGAEKGDVKILAVTVLPASIAATSTIWVSSATWPTSCCRARAAPSLRVATA